MNLFNIKNINVYNATTNILGQNLIPFYHRNSHEPNFSYPSRTPASDQPSSPVPVTSEGVRPPGGASPDARPADGPLPPPFSSALHQARLARALAAAAVAD